MHAQYSAQHVGVGAVEHLLHLVIHSPALAAVEENGLYRCNKEPLFEFRVQVGFPDLVHIVQGLPGKSFPRSYVFE